MSRVGSEPRVVVATRTVHKLRELPFAYVKIDQLFVNYVGAEVTAGQPLAAIYSRDLLVARSE